MTIVHLDRKDQTVDRLLRAAFPGYNGRKVKAQLSDTVSFQGTQWDEGNKTDYAIVRMVDLTAVDIAEAPFTQRSDFHSVTHTIPPGFVVVAWHACGTWEYVEIISPPDNVSPLLPKPTELSEDEKTVLAATVGLKASYGGVSDFRYQEAKRKTGITKERWESAKVELISRKLLNKAGAITTEGRNAIGSYRL